jgi:hypothetical protein
LGVRLELRLTGHFLLSLMSFPNITYFSRYDIPAWNILQLV